jgi:hypothetical protein
MGVDPDRAGDRAVIRRVRTLWDKNPLLIIVLAAAVFRLLAAVFSKGYSMHDDHFVFIETPQRWLEGHPTWLDEPEGVKRSLIYPGFHYLLFAFLEAIRVTDPQQKMLVVRLIHAAYSMLTVIYGYLIALHLTDLKIARKVGILLAVFWLMPFMSVRNLVEFVCVPPFVVGFYFALGGGARRPGLRWLLAGILFGVGFMLRYQCLILVGGAGLVILLRREWKALAAYTLGFLLASFFTQGITDWIAFGRPFLSLYNYVIWNIGARHEYVTGPWYRYALLILGVLIPPVSLLLIFGFLSTWRKAALIFWPVLVFIVLHSTFPNKQERFMLPVLPFVIMLGVVGWETYARRSAFWNRHRGWLKGLWTWFWSVNLVMLLILTFTYSKKNCVETLYYLSRKDDVTGVIWETYLDSAPFVPRFYLNKDVPVYELSASRPAEGLKNKLAASGKPMPNYVVFLGTQGIEKRIREIETVFQTELKLETRVDPSLIDLILHKVNPRHNVSQVSYVYKITNSRSGTEL